MYYSRKTFFVISWTSLLLPGCLRILNENLMCNNFQQEEQVFCLIVTPETLGLKKKSLQV